MSDTPTPGKNKAIVQKLFYECFNKKKLELLYELLGEEFTDDLGSKGPEGFSKTVNILLTGFPDIEYKLLEVVAEDNLVAVRWHWVGTHKGMYRGFEPTGKKITNDGMAIFRLKNNKIIEANVQTDRLGFLQQAGVLPADITQLQKVDN